MVEDLVGYFSIKGFITMEWHDLNFILTYRSKSESREII